MFKNDNKTIGVFINRAEQPLQHYFCRTIIEEAEVFDYNLVFLAAYEIRESKGKGENEVLDNIIVDFAPLESLDAVILALDTFQDAAKERIVAAIKKRYNGPVISYKESRSGFYNILSGEDRGAGTLVRHLYSVHDANKICFFMDSQNFRENLRRETFYRDSMEDCGLEVEDSYIFQSSSVQNRGDDAYKYFFEGKDSAEWPDAVICADDTLARELCNSLITNGIMVPDNVMVCGFNDSYESREFTPRISTVSADIAEMSHETIKLVDDIFSGRRRGKRITVPEQTRYRESCGCSVSDQKSLEEFTRTHYQMLDHISISHVQHSFFEVDLDGAESFEAMKQVVADNINLLGDVDEFYLCLNSRQNGKFRIFTNEIEEKVQLELYYKDGKAIIDDPITFEQRYLLPNKIIGKNKEKKIYYFSLLHNRERIFGYTALNFKNKTDALDFFHHDWNMTVGLAINTYFSELMLQDLIEKNEKNSVTDFLTQMPNRRGFDKYVEENWDEWVKEGTDITFMALDLDGLKYINDTFGHKEGDWAISTIGTLAKTYLQPVGLAARTGGDEFVAVLKGNAEKAVEIENNIYERIEQINKSCGKEYPVGVSIGHCYEKVSAETSYADMMKKSDQEMYKVKIEHKGGREEVR